MAGADTRGDTVADTTRVRALFLIDWGAYTRTLLAVVAVGAGGPQPSEISRFAAAVAPGPIAANALILLSFIASAACAYADRRALTRLGVVKPFPWGWNLLCQPLLYMIGRAVVLNRRGWRGMGPLWLVIAGTVVGWVVTLILMSSIFASMA